jgi:hypothetical protein
MSIVEEKAVLAGLRKFAWAVTARMTSLALGEPEDQLRSPFEMFMQDLGRAVARDVICTGETRLPGRLGKPDYAVHAGRTLIGYVELKDPGIGAVATRFTGRNADQYRRFSAIPNLIYRDGNEWSLYRNGERASRTVRLSGDVTTDGTNAVSPGDVRPLFGLLTDFLSWQPLIPQTGRGEIDLKGLAALLAPLCRMLRDDVTDALRDPGSPLVELARDWRQLLFPDASDEQFADAYAQTVTFALLLARSEGAEPLALEKAETSLAAEHTLLSRALQVLTDPNAQAEISASLNLLVRIIGAVPPKALAGPKEPWLYFYEDFLAAYDPKLRKDVGAYYTPVEVVRAQVRLIDDLLSNRMGKSLGFADPGVVTLDPAVGTGTYLLGVIDHALAKVDSLQGPGAIPGQTTALAENIYGFEIMVGPFAVSELRVSRALEGKGARLPAGGTHVYLTDTLESPDTPPPKLPLFLRPIADEHVRALKVKAAVPVIGCLGNPPYDRHEAADEDNKARTGGWVRWGQDGKGTGALFKDFLEPAIEAGHGVHIKNIYNLYVYFWRWALWKVLEQNSSGGPGVVSFISASSYLGGDAFRGMRQHMRRVCDEIWILDLGGEARGARKSENVFAIQTPVAIAVAARYGKRDKNKPARVRYARLEGVRGEKLRALDSVSSLASLDWEDCPDDWLAPFEPTGAGEYFGWPLLTELMPWQHSGVQLKRTWPIAPSKGTLEKRWRGLLLAKDRSYAFRRTGDREVGGTYHVALTDEADSRPIAELPNDTPVPPIVPYSYRTLDRRWIIADGRLMSRPRPILWAAHSDRQVYVTSSFTEPVGTGPAVTACAHIPDLHHFSGRGAKDVVPLYRDAACEEANIRPGLPHLLAKAYERRVTPDDFLAYIYGVLAHPAFTARYAEQLSTRQLRVPITSDAALFLEVRDIGAKLLWLHTYGERYVPKGRPRGQVPKGHARCTKPVPGDKGGYPETYEYIAATKTLRVGAGAVAPVAPEVYNFEVSGLMVVQHWLTSRMRVPKGKKSSPLDDIRPERWTRDFTNELLELLWILEATIAEYPRQAKLLTRVVKGRKIRL